MKQAPIPGGLFACNCPSSIEWLPRLELPGARGHAELDELAVRSGAADPADAIDEGPLTPDGGAIDGDRGPVQLFGNAHQGLAAHGGGQVRGEHIS